MANLNRVLLIGNLTRDPELRYTPSGKAVCNFTLAINSYFATKEGEKKEDTTFVRVTVWGKTGENCAQYLTKGRSAFVEGRLQSRSWEAEDGQKRSAMDVVADNVQFLGGKTAGRSEGYEAPARGGGGGGSRPPADYEEEPAPDDDIPF